MKLCTLDEAAERARFKVHFLLDNLISFSASSNNRVIDNWPCQCFGAFNQWVNSHLFNEIHCFNLGFNVLEY